MHFEGVPRQEGRHTSHSPGYGPMAMPMAMPMPWITPAIASASPVLQKNPQNRRWFST